MKRNSLFRLLSIIVCCSTALAPVWCQQRFSPTLFGLDTASTGESRYEVLYRTHEAANAAGAEVDYTGIDTLRLRLPEGWKMPLTRRSIISSTSGLTISNIVFATNCSLLLASSKISPVNLADTFQYAL